MKIKLWVVDRNRYHNIHFGTDMYYSAGYYDYLDFGGVFVFNPKKYENLLYRLDKYFPESNIKKYENLLKNK